jgi:excisionase family DNA binding protein
MQTFTTYHNAEHEAERLGVSVRTIRTWQKNRRIPSIRIVSGKGGIIRFDPVAVDTALKKFTVTASCLLAVVGATLSYCASSTPIQRYSESVSHFDPPPVLMSHNVIESNVVY